MLSIINIKPSQAAPAKYNKCCFGSPALNAYILHITYDPTTLITSMLSDSVHDLSFLIYLKSMFVTTSQSIECACAGQENGSPALIPSQHYQSSVKTSSISEVPKVSILHSNRWQLRYLARKGVLLP